MSQAPIHIAVPAQGPIARREAAVAAQLASERRSLENTAIPITASALDALWGYGPTRSGVQINETTAPTYAAVYCAVKILGESIGTLPMGVFAGDPDGTERARDPAHPAHALLRHRPNPEMSAFDFREAMQANLSLWGNAYARIVRNRQLEPVALWPLLSSVTHPERRAGQLVYKVEGQDGGTFAPEEVLHLKGLTLNGVTGLSPVGLLREAIALGKAAELFGAALFGNGARPAGLLSVDEKLDKVKAQQYREQWDAQYAGVGNASRTAVLGAGTKYQQISINPEDAQFLETRKFQIAEIARIYRIPPHMLMDLDRSTNNNIETQGQEFLTYTLLPWLEKWEQEVNYKLLGLDSQRFVLFDVRRFVRADFAARNAYYAAARQWGWMSVNDIRSEEGMNPIPGGNTYLQPTNMQPAGTPPAPPARGGQQGGQTGAPAPGDTAGARAALMPVFEDAVARMLRKERKARSRAGFDADRFYAEHRRHVAESLAPAFAALGASPAAVPFADERHADLPEDLSALVRAKAAEIVAGVSAGA